MVHNRIREVLKNILDILLAFQDARPKVFIRRNDDKVRGVLQIWEDFVLERHQVEWNLMPSKLCLDLLKE
jgi:hypothetical protein